MVEIVCSLLAFNYGTSGPAGPLKKGVYNMKLMNLMMHT